MNSPRDVFAALSDGISEGRFSELSALYAEDVVVEHPQAVPRPTRLHGRAAVHERFTSALAGALRLNRKNVVVHETTDPEVIVAEYDYDAESVATGRTIPAANIQVLRIRDGLIVHSRDYHDYLRLAVIRDGVDQLVKAYEQAPPRDLSPIGPRTSSDPASRRGVFERLVHGVCDKVGPDLAELYAEPTHVTHPFQPGSAVVRTREELRAHFGQAAAMGVDFEIADLVTYEGTDPEVLIAEFAYQGEYGGRPVRIANIFAMRIRDGLVVESRDYGDHLGIAGDLGTIPELAAKL
ncbi:nuclear transport factor 2 family protein [Amycolatopsis vancoresmycina]|uniref:Ketosteroid isomerase-related protein n=1 Tax=Amycolatopsis vancoresmycina DSM 44592 TaxID=1292037 RepID=R1HVU9_9PSEU|nr:nuclear transport factor 2 family protein [Amycolatopsis vancoresmycina]EOD67685.1 ketosteroid isomerase-related protein [Amycolatopsis vancoresmycina DSM 44592]